MDPRKKTELGDLPDELIMTLYDIDVRAARRLALCSRRYFSLFGDARFQNKFEKGIEIVNLEEEVEHIGRKVTLVGAQCSIHRYIADALYRSDLFHSVGDGDTSHYEYDIAKHRSFCFSHILTNSGLSFYDKLFAIYTLLTEEYETTLGTTLSQDLQKYDSAFDLPTMKQLLENKYSPQTLSVMQNRLLTEIHETSYHEHYKEQEYKSSCSDETNKYWQNFFLTLEKRANDDLSSSNRNERRCSLM